jgi:hypothetical protein
MPSRRFWIAALAGGMLAGTLDIFYAIAYLGIYNKTPLWVLQSVATGWLGKAAFTGGTYAGLVGLASHYGISLAAATVYGAARHLVPWMRSHWVVSGAIFGVGVYLFMSFVVVPLSAAPFKMPAKPEPILRGFISHALLFGIPIAWCATKEYSKRASRSAR